MFKKILVLILFVASYWLLATNCHAQDENITITTYYPSPYGVYNELRLHPHHPYTTACVSTQEGNMYYDNDPARPVHALRVCMCTNSDCSNYDWVDVGTGGGGLWTNVGTNLHTTDPNWNVGIGTTGPAEKLEVTGNIKLSGASPTYKITNVAMPVLASDVATKGYVDAQTAGGAFEIPCGWITTGLPPSVGSCNPSACPSGYTSSNVGCRVTSIASGGTMFLVTWAYAGTPAFGSTSGNTPSMTSQAGAAGECYRNCYK